MINLVRRSRQARQNVDELILGVLEMISNNVLDKRQAEIRCLQELDLLIADIEPNVLSLAQTLYSDWAIPIVLQAVGELYYGKFTQYNYMGNYFKRTVAYLWKNSFEPLGQYKNIARLKELISQSYVIETLYSLRKMFFAISNFRFSFKGGHVIIPDVYNSTFQAFGIAIGGRGKRLRVAKTNSQLMNEYPLQFFNGLVCILEGAPPKNVEIFNNTFYESIPGIENKDCERFWKEVFFRFGSYLTALTQLEESDSPADVVLFKEFAIAAEEIFLSQDIVENSFWKKSWFDKQISERYGNLIVSKPIVRISPEGDFATSPVLIGDSLNFFVEEQLLGYTNRSPYLNMPEQIFKDAFSEKFEDQCIKLFRNHGYLAGHVLKTGAWCHQKGTVDLSIPETELYGEIDVLAFHPGLKVALLIECKVLLDIRDSRSYQNISSKLRDDSEGFRSKLHKKGTWLKQSFQFHYNLSIDPVLFLVTDIPLPIFAVNNENEDVLMADFYQLEYLVENILDAYKIDGWV